MKKFICFVILILLTFPHKSFAQNSYITLEPYPYANHVLGEDLTVYGDTDFSYVSLGLYYPKDQGYQGKVKYIITLTADELRSGYVIPTGTYSNLWPEGEWRVKVQYDDFYAEQYIAMGKTASFDQRLYVSEYDNSTLTALSSYKTRGVQLKNNILSLSLEDNSEVKIFSWSNLSPVCDGESRIFIARYKDGFLTDIKTYQGTISHYGYSISLKIDNFKTVKLFCWRDNLTPR